LHHVGSLDAKSAEAFAGEHCITNGIAPGLKVCPVLASIHFDDQAM